MIQDMYQKRTLGKYNAKINFKLFLESTWSIVDWLVVRFTYSRGERTLFQTFGKSFKEVLDNFLAREKISISFHYKPELHCNQTPSANFLKQTNNTEYEGFGFSRFRARFSPFLFNLLEVWDIRMSV